MDRQKQNVQRKENVSEGHWEFLYDNNWYVRNETDTNKSNEQCRKIGMTKDHRFVNG